MKSKVIDYSQLEKVMIQVEDVFQVNKLDINEKQLVLGQISQRMALQRQKQQTQDLLGNIDILPLKGIMKRFSKEQED